MVEDRIPLAIAILAAHLPSFAPVIAEFIDLFGEDLGVEVVFGALAEATEGLMAAPGGPDEARLETLAAALEAVASDPAADPVEAVALGYLDRLCPSTAKCLDAFLPPATERLARRLGEGELDDWQMGWPDG